MFKVVGKTTDNQPVISGVFRFYETHGLPLDVLLDMVKNKNYTVSWLDFYKEAALAGMKHSKIISLVTDAVRDVYEREYAETVLSRLNQVSH